MNTKLLWWPTLLSLLVFGLFVAPANAQAQDSSLEIMAVSTEDSEADLPAMIEPELYLAQAQGLPSFSIASAKACPGMAKGCEDSLASIELTDEQYEKLYQLKNAMLDKLGPKFVEMMNLERHKRMLLSSEKIDRKAVKDLQAKINDLKSDISDIRIDNKLDGLDVLTNEQRKKIHDCAIKKSFCCKFMGRRMKMKGYKRDMD